MADWIENQWNAFLGIERDDEQAPAGTMSSASTGTGAVSAESLDTQAAQRRLARLSKYFTSPTGILNDSNVGTTGVLS